MQNDAERAASVAKGPDKWTCSGCLAILPIYPGFSNTSFAKAVIEYMLYSIRFWTFPLALCLKPVNLMLPVDLNPSFQTGQDAFQKQYTVKPH